MSRLLHAGRVRVGKDPLYRMGMILMVLLGVFLVGIAYYTGIKEHEPMYLSEILYIYLPVIGFMCAIFCGYFSGQEYYDGTIRNKLIAGHSRTEIYFSNVIINVCAVLLLWLILLLTEIILGTLLLDGIGAEVVGADGDKLLGIFMGSLLTIVALCSIFTLIAMVSQNHSTSDAICILVACILLCSSLYVWSVVGEIQDYDRMVEEGCDPYVDKSDAFYPRLKNRESYEFLHDCLPSGQMIQYVSMNVRSPERLPLYSLGIIFVTTSIGVLVFQKKNIR